MQVEDQFNAEQKWPFTQFYSPILFIVYSQRNSYSFFILVYMHLLLYYRQYRYCYRYFFWLSISNNDWIHRWLKQYWLNPISKYSVNGLHQMKTIYHSLLEIQRHIKLEALCYLLNLLNIIIYPVRLLSITRQVHEPINTPKKIDIFLSLWLKKNKMRWPQNVTHSLR
jgi:hypothetical protein